MLWTGKTLNIFCGLQGTGHEQCEQTLRHCRKYRCFTLLSSGFAEVERLHVCVLRSGSHVCDESYVDIRSDLDLTIIWELLFGSLRSRRDLARCFVGGHDFRHSLAKFTHPYRKTEQRFETTDTGIKSHPILICRIFYCNFAIACFQQKVSELPFINASPQYIFIFPGKQRKARVTRKGEGGWEVQTVQSVEWKRHPASGLSGSHPEQIFREEQTGYV
jgi:hypothetical protein